jgi:hypothetical protein
VETKRNFSNYQQVSPSDLMAMQTDAETSIDNIVLDTLIPNRGYSGFGISKTGPAQVTIQAGRLYVNGKVYALTTTTVYDLTPLLPVAANRIVSVYVWGSEQDSNVTAVNFLSPTDSTPTNPVYRPQQVALDHLRVANIGNAAGTENPNPSAPVLDSTLLTVATVMLSPTGVVTASNVAGAQVPNLQDVDARVDSLETWEAEAAPEITSLAAALSRLSNNTSVNYPISADQYSRILARLATVEAKDGIPSNALDSGADFFLDTSGSDLANVLSSVKVEEGIRFPDDGANDQPLELFNPLDANAMVKNGVLFPAYDRYQRQSIGPITGAIQMSAYTYSTTEITQKTMARTRIRYGTAFDVCTNSAWWATGSYNPITSIFTLPDGETFNVTYNSAPAGTTGQIDHVMMRVTEFWVDTVNVNYWDVETTTGTLAGAHIAETFPCGQDTWLESIGVYCAKLDATGSVTLLVCEANASGQPDIDSVLGQVTLDYSALALAPAETIFTLPTPVYLQAGQRYAFVLVSGANHFIASADGTSFPQGTLFTLTAGGYAVADLTKHIAFNLYSCKFRLPLVSIQMQNLQLAGGMTSIDLLAAMIAPGSTALTWEIQLAGIWTPLNSTTVGLLNSGGALPPNVPIRGTFAGSPDIMPVVSLTTSNVHVARPKTSLTHITTARARPSSTSIRCTERYEAFDPTFHAASMHLLTGGTFATSTAPASYSDVTNDDGSIERTYVWNLGGAVTSYKLETQMTTTTALKTALVSWLKDWVL